MLSAWVRAATVRPVQAGWQAFVRGVCSVCRDNARMISPYLTHFRQQVRMASRFRCVCCSARLLPPGGSRQDQCPVWLLRLRAGCKLPPAIVRFRMGRFSSHSGGRQPLFDVKVLNQFIDRRFGYGSYDARFWFISMQEGCGNSLAELVRRVEAWDERGRKELDDLVGYSRTIKVSHWFDGDRPRLQSTWARLIRIFLTAEGQPADKENIRSHQQSRLGRLDGEPTPSTLPRSTETDRGRFGDHRQFRPQAGRNQANHRYLLGSCP